MANSNIATQQPPRKRRVNRSSGERGGHGALTRWCRSMAHVVARHALKKAGKSKTPRLVIPH